MENEFPPNSHTARESRPARRVEKDDREPKREVQRVTSGKVIRRKKPIGRRIAEAFTMESLKSAFEHMLVDVMLPGAKDLASDAIDATKDRILYGEEGYSPRGRRGRGYTSYSSMGGARVRDRRDRDRDDDRPTRRHSRPQVDHREIILDNRHEAERVIDGLFELISKYEVATLRDLLSMVGEPHNFTAEDWGWTDLRGARAHRVQGGYLLDLPRPEALD